MFKKVLTVDFNYAVDFCKLIGNQTPKYRDVKKASQTSKKVRDALDILGNWIRFTTVNTFNSQYLILIKRIK